MRPTLILAIIVSDNSKYLSCVQLKADVKLE